MTESKPRQDIHAGKPLVRRIERKFKRGLLASKKMLYAVLPRFLVKDNACRIVTVAGVQRSGTNMVMNVFEQPAYTRVYHERDPRLYDGYQMISNDKLYSIVDGHRHGTLVFKALCELQYVSEYLDRYPAAQCVWVFRHYGDVVDSHLRHGWYRMPEFIRAVADGDEETAGWRLIDVPQSVLEEVRCLAGQGLLDNASACALFWYYRNLIYYQSGLNSGGRSILIDYDDMVAAPERAFRALFEWLGMPFRRSYTANVRPRLRKKHAEHEFDDAIQEACEDLYHRMKRDGFIG